MVKLGYFKPAPGRLSREGSQGWCTEHYQFPWDKRPFTIVDHGDRLSVEGYSNGYFAFGSVAGCAMEHHEDVEMQIRRSRTLGHRLQWINALPSIIDNSGKTGEQKAMEGAPVNAKMHKLTLGSLVWFEGQTYRLDKDHNRNVKLVAVRCHFNGDVTEGEI
jgi:hypothetical protein